MCWKLFAHKGKIWKAPKKCPKNTYTMALDMPFIWSYFRQLSAFDPESSFHIQLTAPSSRILSLQTVN